MISPKLTLIILIMNSKQKLAQNADFPLHLKKPLRSLNLKRKKLDQQGKVEGIKSTREGRVKDTTKIMAITIHIATMMNMTTTTPTIIHREITSSQMILMQEQLIE